MILIDIEKELVDSNFKTSLIERCENCASTLIGHKIYYDKGDKYDGGIGYYLFLLCEREDCKTSYTAIVKLWEIAVNEITEE